MNTYTQKNKTFRRFHSNINLLFVLLSSWLIAPAFAANISVGVWNDANGNGQKVASESMINGTTTPLWINLIDPATSQVIGQGAINNSGVITISGASNSASYKLILTATQPVIGSTLSASALPTNYVHTGINTSTGATGTGNTSNTTGIIDINMPATGNLANIYFGIERLPAALSVTAATQQNPNGNYKVAIVAPNALDAEDGNIWTTGTGTVKIETLPTDGTLYYNGTAVTVGQTITNFNDELLLVDPNDGTVNISFDYSVIDKAGQASPTTGTVTLPFTAPVAFVCDSYFYQVIAPSNLTNSTLYKYNPFTGDRTAIKLLDNNYNAIGYNQLDNMIYGTDIHSSQIVRIDSEGNERLYTVPNLPYGPYNVADITEGGYLYIYSGLGTTFYIIDVNELSPTYMQLVDPQLGYAVDMAPYGINVIGYAISDMAYNPIDKMFYGMIVPGRANSFKILKLNPVNLSFTLSSSAVTGAGIQSETEGSGATFFDQEGNFYVFGNSQGKYYSIDLATNTATLLSTETPNGSNDGASCPLAPPFQIDLGDAPDTYKTLLNSGGPSHVLSSDLLLGTNVDAEDEGLPTIDADGDDSTDTPDDEDALAVIPPLGITNTSYELDVQVTNTTGADATVSGWIDFNINGVFDSGERAQAIVANGASSVKLNWTGLSGLVAGQSYIRLRLASTASEVANPSGDAGSASNGEVEDYPITIQTLVTPDLTPNITIIPTTIIGTSNILLRVRAIELNNQPTTGPISLYIRSAPEWTITTIPGTAINGWTYVGQVGLFHRFTNPAVLQNGYSQFDVPASFNPGGTSGQYTFTASIPTASGGESPNTNNADQETVSYQP